MRMHAYLHAYLHARTHECTHAQTQTQTQTLGEGGQRIAGVTVDGETVQADTVIMAAGPWSSQIPWNKADKVRESDFTRLFDLLPIQKARNRVGLTGTLEQGYPGTRAVGCASLSRV